MTTPEKRRRGRPEVPEREAKKPRGFSCTDDEWSQVKKQADAAGFGKRASAYLLSLVEQAKQ